jgi:sec-independent protein translocase protein TatA
MGILDWKHWAVILLVCLVVFGGSRLKNAGSDIGAAIKGFRKSIAEDDAEKTAPQPNKVDSIRP